MRSAHTVDHPHSFTTIMYGLLFLTLLGASSVQARSIPACASTCVGDAIDASLCSSVDTRCLCLSETFQPQLTSCIESNCEEEEQADALAHTQQFCDVIKPHAGLRARDAEPEPEANSAQGYGGQEEHKRPSKHRGRQGWWDKAKHKYVYGHKKPKHKKPEHKKPKHKKPEQKKPKHKKPEQKKPKHKKPEHKKPDHYKPKKPSKHPHYKPTTTHKKKHPTITQPNKGYQPTPPVYHHTTTHHKKPHTTTHHKKPHHTTTHKKPHHTTTHKKPHHTTTHKKPHHTTTHKKPHHPTTYKPHTTTTCTSSTTPIRYTTTTPTQTVWY